MLEVRLGAVFPILELLATIGLFYLLNFLSQRQKILIISLLIIIGFSATIKSFIFYTKIAPQTTINNNNYHKLAQTIFKYKSNPGAVLTQSPSSSPYIWYLFENKIDPRLAQQSLIHYPATEESFIHVKQLENIYFETINWDDLAKRTQVES